MKKLISAVLVLALVMAMSVSVFAVSERQKYIDAIEKDFEDLFEGDVAWENVWTVLQDLFTNIFNLIASYLGSAQVTD